jgi:hypothetical protein
VGVPAADFLVAGLGRVRVAQADPLDDPGGDQLVERSTGDLLRDQAGQEVVGVAVGPTAAGGRALHGIRDIEQVPGPEVDV